MLRFFVAFLASIPMVVLLAPAYLLVGLLWAFSAVVRSLAGLFEPRFVAWKNLIEFDACLGWKPRANVDAYYLADRDDVFRVVTDAEGWPGLHSIAESDVIAIGDSFAFGYGVDTASSFACVQPALRIKAIGAPGYSMVQSLLLTEQLGTRLSGKLVVWLVCLENDLEDNVSPSRFQYRSPVVRPSRTSAGWDLVDTHISPEPWRATVWSHLLFPHLCVPGALSDRVYAASDYIVARAAAHCAKVGAKLVLFTVPTPTQLTQSGRTALATLSGNSAMFDSRLPDRRLAESCRRHGVAFAAGLQFLTADDYKPVEGIHWNERGHRRMAEVLSKLRVSTTAAGMTNAGVDVPTQVPRLAAAEYPAGTR